MGIIKFFTLSAAAYLSLEYWIVPMLDKRWRADRAISAIGRAGTLAAMRVIRTTAAMGLLAGALAVVMVALTKAAGGLFSDIAAGLMVFKELSTLLGSARNILSGFVFFVTSAAVIYFGRRIIRRRMDDIYQSAVDKEVARLKDLLDQGRWEDRPASPEMQEVESRFTALSQFLNENFNNLTDEQCAGIRAQLEQLQSVWMSFDVRRRIEPSWDPDDLLPPDPNSVADRFARAVAGRGLFRVTSTLSKTLASVGLVLLFLCLFGLASGVVSQELESQRIRLSELAIHSDKQDALKSVESPGIEADSDRDDSISAILSSRFEQAFANSSIVRGAARANFNFNRPIREFVIREQILANVAETNVDSGLVRYSSIESFDELTPQEKVILHGSAEDLTSVHPRTELGRRFAQDLKSTDLKGTAGWRNVVASYQSGSGLFGQPSGFRELSGDLISEAVGGVISEITPTAETEAGKLANQILRKATQASLVKLYEMKRDQFIAEIARSGDVERAVTRVMIEEPAYVFMARDQLNGLQAATREVPSTETILPKLAHNQPRLGWIDEVENERSARFASELQTNTPDKVIQAVAADLATYEDNFPAQLRTARNTPRFKFLEKAVAVQPSQFGFQSGLTRYATASLQETNYLLDLATNVAGLIGSGRVGGVVIGQDPDRGNAAVGDFSWSIVGSETQLWVKSNGRAISLGSYSTSTVHQALAYAADNRRVAVTMVPVPTGLKILLHPALVDTKLGNSIVELDLFVDRYTRGNASPVNDATKLVYGFNALYQRAWQVRLPAAIGMHQEMAEFVSQYDLEPWQLQMADNALTFASLIDKKEHSPLPVKTEFYDAALVALVKNCALNSNGLMSTFESCIARSTVRVNSNAEAKRLVAPPPSGFPWSVVVEERYAPDAHFDFVKRKPTVLSPFRFSLRQVYDGLTISQFLEDSAEPYTDVTPWDYPAVGKYIQQQVSRVVENNAAPHHVVSDARDFVVLQRFFRAAIRGQLGEEFPDWKLTQLAKETRGYVTRELTPRHN